MKKFGPDDNDALKIIEDYINVQFITVIKKIQNFKKRISNHMGFKLSRKYCYQIRMDKKNFEIKNNIQVMNF